MTTTAPYETLMVAENLSRSIDGLRMARRLILFVVLGIELVSLFV